MLAAAKFYMLGNIAHRIYPNVKPWNLAVNQKIRCCIQYGWVEDLKEIVRRIHGLEEDRHCSKRIEDWQIERIFASSSHLTAPVGSSFILLNIVLHSILPLGVLYPRGAAVSCAVKMFLGVRVGNRGQR